VYPYFALRSLTPIRRQRNEVLAYSADLLAYATTADSSLIWGRWMRWFVKPEGGLFPGLTAAVLGIAGIATTSKTRRAAASSGAWFFVVAMGVAIWLSVGPRIRACGYWVADAGIYGILHAVVPGFAGLRVPARYGMIAGLFLAIVAGVGAAAMIRQRWWRRWLAVPLSAFIVAEGMAVPFRMTRLPRAPGIYTAVAALPTNAVLLELPFGDVALELRYTYFSRLHWRRIVNGYSGFFPKSYDAHLRWFASPWMHPRQAWAMLRSAGVTHVIVHDDGYPPADAARVRAWLDEHGAWLVAQNGHDGIYRVPPATPAGRASGSVAAMGPRVRHRTVRVSP
jgi:hypothetical protein